LIYIKHLFSKLLLYEFQYVIYNTISNGMCSPEYSRITCKSTRTEHKRRPRRDIVDRTLFAPGAALLQVKKGGA